MRQGNGSGRRQNQPNTPNGKTRKGYVSIVAPSHSRALPAVTVILPIRNEEKHIQACLETLLAQDYPADKVEILLIDGRSTDNTRATVAQVAAQHPDRRIHLLDNPQQIVPHALNIGIRAATADIIIRMDGHTVPAPNYITACVNALEATGAANVGGVIGHHSDTPFGQAVAYAQSHPLGVGGAKFRYATKGQYVDTVPFGAFRREGLEKAGLFDESLVRNQDYELNVRIRKAGGTIYLDPAIKATYTPRDTPAKLWRQYLEYGWWRVETLRRHPDSLRWRQAVPPVFVATLALLVLATLFTPAAALLLPALVLPYAGTLGVVAFTLRDKIPGIWRFPLAIAIMHLAWSAGFWCNILSFGRYPFQAGRPHVPDLPPDLQPPPDPTGSFVHR